MAPDGFGQVRPSGRARARVKVRLAPRGTECSASGWINAQSLGLVGAPNAQTACVVAAHGPGAGLGGEHPAPEAAFLRNLVLQRQLWGPTDVCPMHGPG